MLKETETFLIDENTCGKCFTDFRLAMIQVFTNFFWQLSKVPSLPYNSTITIHTPFLGQPMSALFGPVIWCHTGIFKLNASFSDYFHR